MSNKLFLSYSLMARLTFLLIWDNLTGQEKKLFFLKNIIINYKV